MPADFAFIIPIVHPDGKNVEDYGVVEDLLFLTTTSLLAQTHANIAVVVVLHRMPAWANDKVDPRLHFLLLPEHPLCAVNTWPVGEDKGLKYFLALEYARRLGCRAVMPMDGDDFVDISLVRTVLAQEPTNEVLLITQGWFLALGNDEGPVQIDAAFENVRFHESSGSCRVFWMEPLVELLTEVTDTPPDTLQHPDGTVTDEAIVWANAKPGHRQERLGLLQMLGTHVRQSEMFTPRPLKGPLAAKGCGHGNHDGPRAGGIHWTKLVGVRRRAKVMARLGLPLDRRGSVRPVRTLVRAAVWTVRTRWKLLRDGPGPLVF